MQNGAMQFPLYVPGQVRHARDVALVVSLCSFVEENEVNATLNGCQIP